MEYLRVQLKVCEGCGGLWFRAEGSEVSDSKQKYGRCCAGKLAEHARVRREPARVRSHNRVRLQVGGAA